MPVSDVPFPITGKTKNSGVLGWGERLRIAVEAAQGFSCVFSYIFSYLSF